ncbi:MAG TPA: hypothetical protein VMR49_02655 [Candidatus Paceibacterota bacterium]|jgi:hypothetical protein|nr:hypothetical protein [Candidatus Paceibacterota bacterium]
MTKVIYITDITLHSKDFRATPSLEKAEQRKFAGLPSPRFYSGATKLDAVVEGVNPDGTFEFTIDLPVDLREGLDRGEIEIRSLRAGGIPIYPGKDLIEKMAQLKKKERRELIHRSRKWQAK